MDFRVTNKMAALRITETSNESRFPTHTVSRKQRRRLLAESVEKRRGVCAGFVLLMMRFEIL